MTSDEPLEGAKEFLLQEYQNLCALQQEAKAVGETRLNFFVTFVALASTALMTVQAFIVPELRPWLVGGISLLLIIIGAVTYRKMLQRRVAIVIYRRRLSRIRAWFVKYYPAVIPGLPYDMDQTVRMDWGGRGRLGSTAFSVAFINTALIAFAVLAVCLMIGGLPTLVWAIPAALLAAALAWGAQIGWKIHWMKKAEEQDARNLQRLDRLQSAQPAETAPQKTRSKVQKKPASGLGADNQKHRR